MVADLMEGLLALLRADDDDQLAQARELAMVFSWPLDLRGRDLRGCRLHHLAVDEIRVEGAIYDELTSLPMCRHEGRLIGPRANLRGLDLSGRDLEGVDLSYAMADQHTRLPEVYERLNFLGPGGLFEGAFHMNAHNVDLRGACFRPRRDDDRWGPAEGSTFQPSQVTGVDLSGAVFERTHLRRALMRQVDLRGACLRKARLERVRMVRVDLRGADLRGARLVGADLSGARLEGCRWDSVVADARTRWPGGRAPAGVRVA